MRRPVTALALSFLLAGGLSACGSDQEATDVKPKSTPDLVAPENTGLPAPSGGSSTTGTNSSTTSTTDTTATTPSDAGTAPQQSAPAQTTPQQSAPAQTGGTGDGTATTPQAGGTGGGTSTQDSGGFSDFCQQNPGACPGE